MQSVKKSGCELQNIGIIATKQQVKKYLPKGYALDEDIDVMVEGPCKLTRLKKTRYWSVVFFNKNGKNRLNTADSSICKTALEKATKKKWKKDTISNYIFHFESNKKPRIIK